MANTIREQLILKLIARAANITVANGYNTGIGAAVERCADSLDPDSLPAQVLWPQPETVEQQYGCDICSMQVRIEGLMAHGSTNTSVVSEKMLGDLRKCYTDPTKYATIWGAVLKIDSCTYAAGGTGSYAKGGEIITGANILLNIKYQTLIGNPYTQA